MVQVQYDVLKVIHNLIKKKGSVIIVQPFEAPFLVEIKTNEGVLFSEELEEPKFQAVLLSTKKAISMSVTHGLFHIEHENVASTKSRFLYRNEYTSLEDWKNEHISFAIDKTLPTSFSKKMKAIPKSSNYTIKKYYQESVIILKKTDKQI